LEILVKHEESQTPVAILEQPLQVVGVSGEGSDGARLLAQKVVLQEGRRLQNNFKLSLLISVNSSFFIGD
jgi:hypothetical protein